MTVNFPTEFFVGNRKKLLQTTESPLIVLTANGLLQRSTDTTFPFRQDSNFWYLTGVEEADYVLVMTPEEEFLIAPSRGEHRDQWDGAIDTKQLQKDSGVHVVMDHHDGWNKLDRLIKKTKKIHTITPAESYYELFGFYTNPARVALLTSLKKHRSAELCDIRKCLAHLRQTKQEPEIAAIKQAIDITVDTLMFVRENIQKYKTEDELVAEITGGFLWRGAKGNAYEHVVASGKNAATIHHGKHDGVPVKQGEGLLLDVGAEVHNYAADISRTYVPNGKPSKRLKDFHAAVMRVRAEALKQLKVGVVPREYEAKIDKVMARELHKVGLLDDIADKKKFRKLYPHLTSHFLGLDVHDSGDYEAPIEAGTVMTIEPGIYSEKEGIGVRIEDDVLITESGIEILSGKLPTDL